MGAVFDHQIVKSIGASGQISLGKEYAGRTVLVDNPEPGVWIIRTAKIIPDSERWLHEPTLKKNLVKAVEWSNKNTAKVSNPSELKLKKAHAAKPKVHST